jgi:hypothetical protein
MSDERTLTLQNLAADRDWWSADAGRHYHELAHNADRLIMPHGPSNDWEAAAKPCGGSA